MDAGGGAWGKWDAEGPTHFSQFEPLLISVWGRRWAEQGTISAHFLNMVVEGEQVIATVTLDGPDATTATIAATTVPSSVGASAPHTRRWWVRSRAKDSSWQLTVTVAEPGSDGYSARISRIVPRRISSVSVIFPAVGVPSVKK